MEALARGPFEVSGSDDRPHGHASAEPRLTQVSITKSFRGDLEGESTLEYLMLYRQDGCASFVGMERFVGTLGGRTGSFYLQQTGTFEYGTAEVTATVVPASGTAELRGLTGESAFGTGPAEEYPFEFAYRLP